MIDQVVNGENPIDVMNEAANAKTVDMEATLMYLERWTNLKYNQWSDLSKFDRNTADKLLKLSRINWRSAKTDELQVPIQDAKAYLKLFKLYKKSVGKYGGVPAQLKLNKEIMQDAIDEITYEMKD